MKPDGEDPPIDFSKLTGDEFTQEFFKQYATPRVKGMVAEFHCSFCRTPGQDFKVCQKCRTTRYCSKECQKKDWPTHKISCISCDRPNPFKLLKILTANTTIMRTLETAIVLALDIANDTKHEIGIKYPFEVRVDIGVEPCDTNVLMRLLANDASADPVQVLANLNSNSNVNSDMNMNLNNIEGMVRVQRMQSWIPGDVISAADRDNWRIARKEADRCGLGTSPLGIIGFYLNGLGPFTMVGHAIHPRVMSYARERRVGNPNFGVSESGEGLTASACLDIINSHIRADKENELKLRTRMTESDIATIRNSKDPSVNTPGVVAFRQSMAGIMARSSRS